MTAALRTVMRAEPLAAGATRTAIHLGYGTLIKAWHPAGQAILPHAHARPCFSYVVEGAVREEMPGLSAACLPGSLLFKPACLRHSNLYGSTGSRSIILELSDVDSLDGAPLPLSACMRAPSELRRFGWTVSRIRRLPIEEVAPMFSALIRDLHADTLVRRGRAGRPQAWLTEAYDLLRRPGHRTPRVATVARILGVSEDHFIAAFRAAYGHTPGVMVRQARVHEAVRRIRETATPLSVIALSLGYVDQSHMNRELSRTLGVTPRQVRSMGRSGLPHRTMS